MVRKNNSAQGHVAVVQQIQQATLQAQATKNQAQANIKNGQSQQAQQQHLKLQEQLKALQQQARPQNAKVQAAPQQKPQQAAPQQKINPQQTIQNQLQKAPKKKEHKLTAKEQQLRKQRQDARRQRGPADDLFSPGIFTEVANWGRPYHFGPIRSLRKRERFVYKPTANHLKLRNYRQEKQRIRRLQTELYFQPGMFQEVANWGKPYNLAPIRSHRAKALQANPSKPNQKQQQQMPQDFSNAFGFAFAESESWTKSLRPVGAPMRSPIKPNLSAAGPKSAQENRLPIRPQPAGNGRQQKQR
jgi:chemotaxis protein histidine kinase CheA